MSIAKEFFDNLEGNLDKQEKQDAADRNATTWEPEDAGDTLKGIFIKVNFVADKYNPGEYKPVVIVKDEESGDSIKVWGSRTALKNQLYEASPQPGTPIGIRYGGFTLTPDGDYEGYHSYTVVTPERSDVEIESGVSHWSAARRQALEDAATARTERTTARAQRPDEAPF